MTGNLCRSVLLFVLLSVRPVGAGDAPTDNPAPIVAPAALAGCPEARDEPGLDPAGTIRIYTCGLKVKARVWIKPGGWPDADAAFAEAFARMPEIGRHWQVRDWERAWPFPVAGGTMDFIAFYAGESQYRSFRGRHKIWIVPAGARPGVLFEATWEISHAAAGTEAERVLNALVAATLRLPNRP